MFEEARRDEDTRWVLANALLFWRACPTKRCRRAKQCMGDSMRCHEIFWPVVPEEAKVRWRAILDARATNRTARQAVRAADAAAAAWRQRDALMKRLQEKR